MIGRMSSLSHRIGVNIRMSAAFIVRVQVCQQPGQERLFKFLINVGFRLLAANSRGGFAEA